MHSVASHTGPLCQTSNIYYRHHACTSLRSLLMPNTRPCHAQRGPDHQDRHAACTHIVRSLLTASPAHKKLKEGRVQLKAKMEIESSNSSCREVQRRWSLPTR